MKKEELWKTKSLSELLRLASDLGIENEVAVNTNHNDMIALINKHLRGGKPSQEDIDAVRKAILNDLRFIQMPLFGQSAGDYSLFQHLTLAQEIPPTSSLSDKQEASSHSSVANPLQKGQADEAGTLFVKDVSVTIQSLLEGLNKNETVWQLPILASPGAGKTTLLRWITSQAAAEADFLKRGNISPVPVYVSLPDFEGELGEYLANQHKGSLNADAWEKILHSGNCLLLLDGLELVKHTSEVRSLLHKYQHCPVILTCRTVMRQRLEDLSDRPCYILEALSETQQKEYLSHYPKLTDTNRTSLFFLIEERADLRLRFSTPFFLSLLCYVAKHKEIKADASFSLSALYQDAIEIILREPLADPQREPSRLALREKHGLRPREMREALAYTALLTVEETLEKLCELRQQKRTFTEQQQILQKANQGSLPIQVLEEGLMAWSADRKGKSEIWQPLLDDLCANSQILSGDKSEIFSDEILFAHRTLQEFLIAGGLSDKAAQVYRSCESKDIRDKTALSWNAIRPYVDALAWLPEFEETIFFLAGILFHQKQHSVLTEMLNFLADEKQDDQFRHRLALAVLSLPELVGKECREELADRVKAILHQAVQAADEVLLRTNDGSVTMSTSDLGFPHWLERHPMGRVLYAIGSAYRIEEETDKVGIPIGTEHFDPIGLNGNLLDDGNLPYPYSYHLRDFLHRKPIPPLRGCSPLDWVIKQSWKLTLLGSALSLRPVREKLLAIAGDFEWKCIAYPIGTALRYSSERDAEVWFAWFQQMISDYKSIKIMSLVTAFTQTAPSLRNQLVDSILDYLDTISPGNRLKDHSTLAYTQDYVAFALSYFLEGDLPDSLRNKARKILYKVNWSSAGNCLLRLAKAEDIQEDIERWAGTSSECRKFVVAMHLWAGTISTDEALPEITEQFGASVFEVSRFVRALTDEQRRTILLSMLQESLQDNSDRLGYVEIMGLIARNGNADIRSWLKQEIGKHLNEKLNESLERFLWRTLLQLGEDGVSEDDLHEHIRLVAITGAWGWRQQLISLTARLSNNKTVRAELEGCVRGNFSSDIYQEYQNRRRKQYQNAITRLDNDSKAVGLLEKIVTKLVHSHNTKELKIIEANPADVLLLPGRRHVRYAATVALSRAGLKFFSEDIRSCIEKSYNGRSFSSREYEDWGLDIERNYAELEHPWWDWIQAGVRIFPKPKGQTKAYLTTELASEAFLNS